MRPLLYALPGNAAFAARLAQELGAESGLLEQHRFPDGETLVRLDTPPRDRDVILLCTLAHPDEQLLALLFAADAARAGGAAEVGLAAPYLCYLRQDRVFHAGEALTSQTFAGLISSAFDWLATVDPHLHRYSSLAELYRIPAVVASAASPCAEWIRAGVARPLVVGPDEESAQWVDRIGALADAPAITLRKTRLGDREVHVALPDLSAWQGCTPVLMDDIVSSGRTMCAALRQLATKSLGGAICLAVHGVFGEGAETEIMAAGATRIVTTNTIAHPSNGIDVAAALAQAIRSLNDQGMAP